MVHFAVDDARVKFCTKLAGKESWFLPFDKGYKDGAGNPPNPDGIMRDDYKEFPDDEKFKNAFISRDVYNMRARNFILSHLENYNNKAPITIENFTIEHIMPQNANPKDEWKQALGASWLRSTK